MMGVNRVYSTSRIPTFSNRVNNAQLRFAAKVEDTVPDTYTPPDDNSKPKKGFFRRAVGKVAKALTVPLLVLPAMLSTVSIFHTNKQIDNSIQVQTALAQAKQPIDQGIGVKWPTNTKVYASTIQEGDANFIRNEGGQYTIALADQLSDPLVPSLDIAHANIEANPGTNRPSYFYYKDHWRAAGEFFGFNDPPGDRWAAQVAVSSTNPATGWIKHEAKPRFVLVVIGNGAPLEGDVLDGEAVDRMNENQETFKAGADRLVNVLQDEYNIPDENVMYVVNADPVSIAAGIEWLEAQGASHPGAEAMIYVTGFGPKNVNIDPKGDYVDRTQGETQGYIYSQTETMSTSENMVKTLVTENLKGFTAVNVVVDTDGAGSYIS